MQPALSGLTAAEVAARIARGEVNSGGARTSRTVAEILRANVVTRFNLILTVLLMAILAVGDPQDALFGIVLVSNALIGIVQELRAKRTLDRLAVLTAPRAVVVRESVVKAVAIEDVVLDDLVELRNGDQVVADGVVTTAAGLELDESLLTGESEPVGKVVGDPVLSGSFAVAGSGRFQVTAVGEAAYARRLGAEASKFELVRSELMLGINRILRFVTWCLPPATGLLLLSQFGAGVGWRDAVSGTVAGLVGMVPQGLILLTSIAFAVATVTLARRRVLVQELPAVEGLARVDVVCFDKTGTLTDGTMAFAGLEVLDRESPVEAALGALADDAGANATLEAIGRAFPAGEGWARTAAVPFSSARKWSAATFAGHGSWVLGAPEMVVSRAQHPATVARAEALASTGSRVLLLGWLDVPIAGDEQPTSVQPSALVILEERVRPDAAETLEYFAQQGVHVKLISGDSPRTLGGVATRVGLPNAGSPVDARQLPDDLDALADALEESTIFGRVTPHQKQAMVRALQARGHTVAMTGDGVNDALALKTADIGVAMGSGAGATRAVAQIVLLDNRFATLPGVVAEGRRVAANIERVANLFVTKTVWAALFAVAVGVTRWPYPLLPRHLSIIDTLTIGAPAFFLALAPNSRRYLPGFVGRVLRFAIPAGCCVALASFTAFAVAHAADLPVDQQRTAATIVATVTSLAVLVLLALPLSVGRAAVVGFAIAALVALFPFERVRTFAALELPGATLGQTLTIAVAGTAVLGMGWAVSRRYGAGSATMPVGDGVETARRA